MLFFSLIHIVNVDREEPITLHTGIYLVKIDHLFCHSSVNRNVFSINEIILFLTEEQAHAGDILRFAHPSGRMLGMILGAKLVVILILYPAGGDGVYRDMPF